MQETESDIVTDSSGANEQIAEKIEIIEIEEQPSEAPRGLFTDEEAREAVRKFLSVNFAKTINVVQHEEAFMKSLGSVDIKIDYIKCRRFLTTAINNLRDIDFDLIKGTLQKLYKDTDSLFNAYAKFMQENKSWASVFEVSFLKTMKQMQELEKSISGSKMSRDSYAAKLRSCTDELKLLLAKPTPQNLPEIKKLQLARGDFAHHFATARDELVGQLQVYDSSKEALKQHFETMYTSYSATLESRFSKSVNYKAHCLDKLLWMEAEQNMYIRAFFQRANIADEFSMKTFIKYYMRNVDMKKSKDNEWHNYLNELLQMMEQE